LDARVGRSLLRAGAVSGHSGAEHDEPERQGPEDSSVVVSRCFAHLKRKPDHGRQDSGSARFVLHESGFAANESAFQENESTLKKNVSAFQGNESTFEETESGLKVNESAFHVRVSIFKSERVRLANEGVYLSGVRAMVGGRVSECCEPPYETVSI
jgi:hypothetical protein